MTRERRIAEIVLAHFQVPPPERDRHFDRDCRKNVSGGKTLSGPAARNYRQVFNSLSYEERQAAEARL